jgi:hypothetical protein
MAVTHFVRFSTASGIVLADRRERPWKRRPASLTNAAVSAFLASCPYAITLAIRQPISAFVTCSTKRTRNPRPLIHLISTWLALLDMCDSHSPKTYCPAC